MVSLSPLATPFMTVLALGVRTTWDTKNVPFLLQEPKKKNIILFLYFLFLYNQTSVEHLTTLHRRSK